MTSFWEAMGFIRWPLTVSTLIIVALTAYSAMRLFRSSAGADPITKAWLDAILFWGGFALVTGVLGTLVGIVVAAQSIEGAGAVSTSLVWGGVKVALFSSVVGVLVLALASLTWFGLQLRWRYLLAGEAEGAPSA